MNAEPANWAPHTAHALELVREISPAAGQRISLHVWSTATRHATLDADHDDVARHHHEDDDHDDVGGDRRQTERASVRP